MYWMHSLFIIYLSIYILLFHIPENTAQRDGLIYIIFLLIYPFISLSSPGKQGHIIIIPEYRKYGSSTLILYGEFCKKAILSDIFFKITGTSTLSPASALENCTSTLALGILYMPVISQRTCWCQMLLSIFPIQYIFLG